MGNPPIQYHAPSAPRPFLTARWENLMLLTWAVPERVLRPWLPPGCEPDRRGGQCFASFVAFDFLKTRVWGVPWPGYQRFPEVNLRIYVQYRGERGVSFVKELVPQWVTCAVARLIYNEPYSPARMRRWGRRTARSIELQHDFAASGSKHRASLVAERRSFLPAADSEEAFFIDRNWGFGRTRSGRLLRYEVVHPRWEVHPVRDHALAVDFGRLYGSAWAFLAEQPPVSRVLARGSEVSVQPLGVVR